MYGRLSARAATHQNQRDYVHVGSAVITYMYNRNTYYNFNSYFNMSQLKCFKKSLKMMCRSLLASNLKIRCNYDYVSATTIHTCNPKYCY